MIEVKNSEYVCPVHGDIDNHIIFSTIPGHEMKLCLFCWLEKLTEIGVQHVTEKT